MSRKAKKIRLQDPRPYHYGRYLARVIRYGCYSFCRNIWLTVATTLVMVITLLIIFVTVIANSVLSETIASQQAKMDLSYYIKYNVNDETLTDLMKKLQAQPHVQSVSYSTSHQEYEKASNDNVDGWEMVISEGIQPTLPAVLHVKLDDMNEREKLDKYVKNDKDFQEWIDTSVSNSQDIAARQKTIERLSSILTVARRGGLIAGIIFMGISVLIIFNTIRMTIFSRRDEIAMMKSVGADNYFIRGPFLVEAELYGLIAALIAMALGYLILTKLLPSLANYIEVDETEMFVRTWWPVILLAMMAIGWILGYVSARLAIHKYLKKGN